MASSRKKNCLVGQADLSQGRRDTVEGGRLLFSNTTTTTTCIARAASLAWLHLSTLPHDSAGSRLLVLIHSVETLEPQSSEILQVVRFRFPCVTNRGVGKLDTDVRTIGSFEFLDGRNACQHWTSWRWCLRLVERAHLVCGTWQRAAGSDGLTAGPANEVPS